MCTITWYQLTIVIIAAPGNCYNDYRFFFFSGRYVVIFFVNFYIFSVIEPRARVIAYNFEIEGYVPKFVCVCYLV